MLENKTDDHPKVVTIPWHSIFKDTFHVVELVRHLLRKGQIFRAIFVTIFILDYL